MNRALVFAIVLLAVGPAAAGECTLQITRTACPGKEKESFEKCGGKASCTSKARNPGASTSPEQCAAEALQACANAPDRQAVTRSKVVTATFDGKPVEGGKNFCAADRPDFNHCK